MVRLLDWFGLDVPKQVALLVGTPPVVDNDRSVEKRIEPDTDGILVVSGVLFESFCESGVLIVAHAASSIGRLVPPGPDGFGGWVVRSLHWLLPFPGPRRGLGGVLGVRR